MTDEPTIIVQHREELAELLTEAAEIEHNLMCCYLFAAWSLKAGEAEGLTAQQAKAVARWRQVITHVAVDEMTHFANANNLLAAIGGRPRMARPNFPVSPGYHPADVLVQLRPFSKSTIDHFVFLERPEGIDVHDGADFDHGHDYVRAITTQTIMPTAQDYRTVGYLYRSLRDGVQALAKQIGEEALFIGDPSAQIGPPDVELPGLVRVRDLATAVEAIDNIVAQGEGNIDDPEDSHYRKFCSVRDELEELRAEDPGFEPGRAVVANPVQRKPPTVADKVHIAEPRAARVLDLTNALYNQMLRLVGAAYEPVPAATRAGFLDAGISAMFALGPLNDVLTRLPATEADSGRAGMSFAVTREIRVPPATTAVDVLAERTDELAAASRSLVEIDEALGTVADDLAKIAAKLRELPRGIEGTAAASIAPAAAPSASTPAVPAADGELEYSTDPSIPPRRIVDGVEVIEGEALTLCFETKRCIHARHCVLGAPEVFVGNVQGPWIRPDAVPVERLTAIAHRCPSGAITYARKDGQPDEAAPPVNVMNVRENGPYAVHAEIAIEGAPERFRAVLCRCGASKKKPFCDGSHHDIAFEASGEPPTAEKVGTLTARNGRLSVNPIPDGPLAVEGNLEICSGTGRTIDKVTRAKLCRCGGSKRKPYCDGTHRTNGFSSRDSSEI